MLIPIYYMGHVSEAGFSPLGILLIGAVGPKIRYFISSCDDL